MTNTSIIGIGHTNVTEAWGTSIRHLAWYAIEAALDNAATNQIDALYVANMFAGTASNQRNLATLVADFSGLRGIEALLIDAGEASGAAAVRQATMAVASGAINTALVVGVEKASDTTGAEYDGILSTSLDAEYEQIHGMTPTAQAALVMQRYLYEHGVEVSDFANFSVNSHANGGLNPGAMFRNRLKAERFGTAPQIATPISLFDAAPAGDGAAAVIITRSDRAADMVPQPVQIAGSGMATDTLAIHDRKDLLWLNSAELSTTRAMQQANVTHDDIDLFELHDSFTITAALSLEAAGFAKRGEGYLMAKRNEIGLGGRMPISTFGGLKARGNPLGATGVYQLVEVCRQLRGTAGDNQVANATIGMTQNLGGFGGTAVTHILRI
ncbi:MAG: thiolase C-terminal domain-containing protein [Candidatus Promineifilaceae bacterium]